MADIHEFLLTVELPPDLPDAEAAELRWHLGLGLRPERFPIVVDCWPVTDVDAEGEPLPDGRWEVERYPLLAERGVADPRIGGVAFSALERREGADGGGWALSARQVVHSDDLALLEQLLRWLRERAVGHGGGPGCFRCHTRFYEDGPELTPLRLDDGGPVLP